jgi:hypothetical protein
VACFPPGLILARSRSECQVLHREHDPKQTTGAVTIREVAGIADGKGAPAGGPEADGL